MSCVFAVVSDGTGKPLRAVGHRLRQGVSALRSRPDPALDARLRRLIANDAQWHLHSRLTAFDRQHHLMVYDSLRAMGCDDDDVLLAALLHDVGKADEYLRVGVVHRAATVLLQGRLSGLLHRAACQNAGWLRHGLWLNLHHPALGAELAALAGSNARVCELIRLHTDRDAALCDAALAQLQRADDEAL